jgi:hypothetical protein
MTTTAMPYTHLGEALATDYLLVREQFSDAEWERFLATRRFVDDEVLPAINDRRRPGHRHDRRPGQAPQHA